MIKKYLTKNRLLYFIIFCFFFIILFLCPIAGDDWGNYMVGKNGIYDSIQQAFHMYFTWEGRLVSRIFINILTYHKWLWNIVNSLCIVGIICLITKMIQPLHQKRTICFSILTILLMNIFTFSQVVVWVAGNITYFFPLTLMLFYIYILKQGNTNHFLIPIILNIMIPMFVENMAVLMIVINFIILGIRFYQTKKWDKQIIIYIIVSCLFTIFMLLSPGTRIRSQQENVIFNHLDLFHKIMYNIPNFIYYTFIINGFLLFLIGCTSIFYIQKQKWLMVNKIVVGCYLTIIPMITIFVYHISQFFTLPSYLLELVNPNNLLIQIYWFIYIFIYLFLLSKINTEKLVYTLIGFLANGIMLISPTFGYRTSFASYIFLMIPIIQTIDHININQFLEKMISGITVVSCFVFFVFYVNVYIQQEQLKKIIKIGKEQQQQVIEIPSFPSYANCNINPNNEYHLAIFKEYYGIPENVSIKFLPNNWRYIIIK